MGTIRSKAVKNVLNTHAVLVRPLEFSLRLMEKCLTPFRTEVSEQKDHPHLRESDFLVLNLLKLPRNKIEPTSKKCVLL